MNAKCNSFEMMEVLMLAFEFRGFWIACANQLLSLINNLLIHATPELGMFVPSFPMRLRLASAVFFKYQTTIFERSLSYGIYCLLKRLLAPGC
jgi:hypothetical protein